MASEPGPLDTRALAILAALVRIGLRSRRLEADVALAARGTPFDYARAELLYIVEQLEARGLVRRVVHLFDGGILVVLTSAGVDALRGTAHQHILESAPPRSRPRS